MANYEGVILSSEQIVCARNKKTSDVYIVNSMSFSASKNQNINQVIIIELLPEFRDSNGEYGATRLSKSYEGILPFGDNQSPPRKTPLENSWTRARN